MNEDLEEVQTPAAESAETQPETSEKPENGETGAPEVETDEEKNARVAAEDAERTKKREEKRQQSVQRRINELTAEKHAANEMAKQALEQNAKILAMLEGKQTPTQAPQGEPTRDQFTDYEEFVTARAEWRAEQKTQAILEKYAKEQQEHSTKRERETAERTAEREFLERRNAIEKTIPDYRETVSDWEPKLPNEVVEMIVRLPDGPLISYHLAKNPELEAQFREQPAYMHGVLLGQLSATLKTSTKTVSAAPAPGKPVASRPSSSNEPPSDPSLYLAWAKKHLK